MMTSSSIHSVEQVHLRDSGRSPQERNAILGDKYEMGEELGRGAYGQVFKGTEIRTGELVAIKQVSLTGMSQDALQDIMQEIDLLKNLNHKNIVKYIGSYKTRSNLYIILEYMEQGALSQLIKRDSYGVFSEPIIAAYISQVLQGLQYLHAQGVVHRDIKGANILLGRQGQVKLGDFGVATRRVADDNADFDPVGTPYWMAPEVIEMTGGTAAADIWSVACLIVELFTGSPPYFELQPMSALYRIVQDPHPPLPDGTSPELRAFLKRCFHKDPQERPSAQDLLQDKWLLSSHRSLRSSWTKAMGHAHRGTKARDAHETVSSVVQRILAADGTLPPVRRAGPLELSSQTLNSAEARGRGAETPAPPTPSVQAPQHGRTFAAHSAGGGASPAAAVDEAEEARDVSNVHVYISHADDGSAPGADLGPRLSVELQGVAADASSGQDLTHLTSPTPLIAGIIGGQSVSSPQHSATPLDTVLDDLMRRRGVMSSELELQAHLSAPTTPRSQLAPAPVSAGLALGVGPSPGVEAAGDGHEERRLEASELRKLVAVLHNIQQRHSAADMCSACGALQAMITEKSDYKTWFLAEAGIIAVMELLQQQDKDLLVAALSLLLAVIAKDTAVLESLCLVGIVPIVNALTHRSKPRAIRNAAATFVRQLCSTSPHTVQMFVACGGVPVLVGMLEQDYSADQYLISVAMDSIWQVLQVHGLTPVNHFCRLFVKAGLVPHLLVSMTSMCQCAIRLGLTDAALSRGETGSPSQPSAATERDSKALKRVAAHLDHVCNLLLVLSHSDGVVKSHVAQPESLQRLLAIMQDLPFEMLLKTMAAVQTLTLDPQVLRRMQEARAVPLLVEFLRRGETKSAVQMSPRLQLPLLECAALCRGRAHQRTLLQALHNLCKVSKERQGEAASAGITAVLSHLAERMRPASAARTPAAADDKDDAATRHRIRALCISLLCALAHSNSKTRTELWTYQGLDLFVDLLREPEWRGPALDALAIWLMEDTQRVEPKLLVKSNLSTVVTMFKEATRDMERLLNSFDRMLNSSTKLCVAFGSSELPTIMLDKLANADAFLATCVLDVIQSLYESHPRPKTFILKYDLPGRLDSLKKKHKDAIKVLDKCQMIIRAINVNSVL